MKLKNIITKRILSLTLISAIIISVFLCTVFYINHYKTEKDNIMKNFSIIDGKYQSLENIDFMDNIEALNYNITIFSPNDEVLYKTEDSFSAKEGKENYIDIVNNSLKDKKTFSKTVRKFSSETYLYGGKTFNNNTLLLAKKINYFSSVTLNIFVAILILFICITFISLMMSTEFTKELIDPINNMTIETGEPKYEELRPLVETIKGQKEEIKRQMENVLKIEKIRQEFTANVTHELKTPITSISGYAEMIETGMAKPEDTQLFAKKIRQEAGRLLLLIEDIIELSHLDDTKMAKTLSRIDLFALAKECVESLQMYAKQFNVTVEVRGTKTILNVDDKMAYELIYNLCDNAIRYNKYNGRVVVTVNPLEKGAKVTVADTGIGIPEEHQERIFERFYRVDKSRSKQTGGTGLGLAIVKHIAEQHNAEIMIESEINVGTVVTVIIPEKDLEEPL